MPPKKKPASARDLSAFRRLEEELRTSEARLRSVLDNVPDLILETDRDGLIRYANRLRPGYEPQALAGLRIGELVVQEERATVARTLERAWRTGRSADLEVQAPDQRGRITWWWARVAPVVREGVTTSLLVATREITKRKLAEQALRSAEQKLRELLDTISLLAVIVDAKGRVTYCNDHFLILTGWRQEDVLGAPWLERCVPPDTREIVAPLFQRMLRSASMPAHFEHAVLARDGARRLIAWSHTVLRTPEGGVAALASLGEDITDRRMAEEALRTSEEKFRALFAASMDAIALYDTETARILDANEAFVRLYGYSREELLALTALDLSDEPDDTRAAFQRLREPGPRPKVRRRGRRKDGTVFLADISDGVYEWRGRRVVWVIVRDVTEQVRAAEALRAAHEEMETTLRALPDLLFVLGVDRRITDFRAPHAELLYTTPDRFIGRTMAEVLPPDAAAVIDLAVDTADRTGSHYGAVYALDLPSGRRWFDLSIARRGEAGSPERSLVALVRDITAQHVAEDALRSSEAMNRGLVEGAGANIALFDPAGRVLLLNPSAAELLGGAPGDFTGRRVGEVATILDHKVIADRLDEVVRTGEPSQFEDPVRLPAGLRWFLSKWQPLLDPDGVLTGVLLIALDITDRKLAEERGRTLAEKLQQTQRLESLGVLAGGIAHDFNNLLSGILGNADLALLELPPGSPAQLLLEQVRQGARRAAELTRQMLAYSGRGRFVIETVQLPQVVTEMGKLLEVSISKKNVLRFEFADSLPAVDVDVAQFRQVVMNLIINASEAIGDRSGVIALRVGAADLDAARLSEYLLGEELAPGSYVTLEVADTGEGMTPEVKERIFEPFFSTKFAGRGLGLSATLGIVRGHRGGIHIRSAPGDGTTFLIVLPASTREALAAGSGTSKPLGWRGAGLILVVDDEESVRSTSRRMLERMGFEVLAAGGGREALVLLDAHAERVRAVLLDLTMPDLDGVQTCTQIQRQWPALPVVLTSGYSEQEVMPRFAERKPAAFLQKPYGYDTLLEAMRAVLG